MTTKQEAFEQGVEANYEGQFLVANPYLIDGDEELRDAWEAGHQSVQHVRDAWESEIHRRAVQFA